VFRFPTELESILADRTHGSSVLAGSVARYLTTYRAELSESEFVSLASGILCRRPHFALLFHLLHATGAACFERTTDRPGERVQQAAGRWLAGWEEMRRQIRLPRADPSPGERVLTWSHSGTVQACLQRHREESPGLCVTCPRSQPGGEGTAMAAELAAAGVAALVVDDSAAWRELANFSSVVIGADALHADLFWNKVGTGRLLRLAAAAGRPVFLVAESCKWCHPAWGLRPGQPDESAEFLEPVSNQLVTFLVTELGASSPGDSRALSAAAPVYSPLLPRPVPPT